MMYKFNRKEANQVHILDLAVRTEELLYMGAMVKQIGILQTTLTARVDMCESCKPTPKLLKIYKPLGQTSRVKYMA